MPKSVQVTIDPKTLPKFTEQLVVPPVYKPLIVTDPDSGVIVSHDYNISMEEFVQQILPPSYPPTKVWGYCGDVIDSAGNTILNFKNAPGATFEAKRGIAINVTWTNNIFGTHPLPVDPTLHWANPNLMQMNPPPPWPPFPPGFPDAQSPVPLVPHLHGGEQESKYDGHPDAWWTANGKYGPSYTTNVYHYPNTQNPTTLWYHDHALGITRLNVVMGLAGFYLLRDSSGPIAATLPSGIYEIPLVIQDRMFDLNGQFYFPAMGINPNVHPYWQPEFFGDTITVNGKVWPNLDVEPRQYRFRLLNGSNARFYTLSLSNRQKFVQIGSDGGYLPAPVIISELTVAPGERADILIDFSTVTPGTKIIMQNTAKAPFPKGTPPDPATVGQIMQFSVTNAPKVSPQPLPATLNTITPLAANAPKRSLTLVEVMGAAGPTEVLLDGQKWHTAVSEKPQVGATEVWEIINLTADTHPIHLHLIQFQLINRQSFQVTKYMNAWIAANGGMMPPLMAPTVPVDVTPYLQSKPKPPAANEKGWKDTIQMNPGEVTRIIVRWAPQDAPAVAPGTNSYAFDPTTEPGYVWHCHILDHEDNEMMRPYKVIK